MPAPDEGLEEERWVRVERTRGGALVALRAVPQGASPQNPAPICLVLADPAAPDAAAAFEAARELARVGVDAGCACYVTGLTGAEPGAAGAASSDVPDRAALARLDGLLASLAEETSLDHGRVAVMGLGRGGTLAFLFACHSSRVQGAAALGAPLVYPELGPARPVQPLELALNLGCPLLLIDATEDPATPAPERERVRAVLSQFARSFDIVALPGAAPWPRAEAQAALERFLETSLELG